MQNILRNYLLRRWLFPLLGALLFYGGMLMAYEVVGVTKEIFSIGAPFRWVGPLLLLAVPENLGMVLPMAAVLGGTQSLHTNSRDEALSLPTQTSAMIALRTQQILAFESRIADVVDPFGGSYLIESLTDQLQAEAEALIKKVDEAGGMVSAIEKGIPQREIQNAAYAFQKGVERGENIVVGVNKFTIENEKRPDLLRVDEALGERRRKQVAEYREQRDNGAVRTALEALTAAAAGTDNLMPKILAAVKAESTVGEVADAMRTVFGEYQERLVL